MWICGGGDEPIAKPCGAAWLPRETMWTVPYGRVSNPPESSQRLLSPVPSQLTTRVRGTNDTPTHMSIPPNAVRLIPFHYIIVITDGTVG
ncbi:MAG: hypothetical protein FWD57_13000, partial [Polyangiaceae bacterium]|nr:hypothetical protein [Polyangiaceae bacterium]